MPRRVDLFVAAVVLLFSGDIVRAQESASVDFARDVQPLLQQHCVSCHGPGQRMAGLRLDRRTDALRGGTLGAVIGPGNGDASRLYIRISSNRFGPQMPPTGAMKPEEIQTIKAWIDQGAVWPDEVSGETPATPPDPRAERLMRALRANDRGAFERALTADPEAARLRGSGGSTPLMYAALYADVASMRLLLDRGADPNTGNDAGATALMWAVGDRDKVTLLVDRGADVNARSGDGRTPLMIAAARSGSSPVLEILLQRGAQPNVKAGSLFGVATPLSEAAYAGDLAALVLLLKKGAEPKFSGFVPLGFTLQSGCKPCFDLMAAFADRQMLNQAMAFAVPPFGDGSRLQWLLDRGAELPPGRGADASNASAKASTPQTAPDRSAPDRSARASAPANPAAPASDGYPAIAPALMPAHAPSPRAAVERSLPLLQRTGAAFLAKSGCVSCHNNTLMAMAVATARDRGIPVDEDAARAELTRIAGFVDSWRDRVLQNIGIPGDADTISYILHGLAAEKHAPDAATDAMAHFLKNRQLADGRWRILAHRPPIESNDIQVTATSLRALQVYAPAGQRAEFAAAVQRAAAWLATAEPRDNEGRAFRLLGLAWAGAKKELVRAAADELVATQRADGGWAQLPSLESDAYATGQALVALLESGALSSSAPVYQRGVRFLLGSQHADGSWHVKTRAIPIQPLFDIGFPHGRDSWISAAGTNWAVTALALAADTPPSTSRKTTAMKH